MASSGSARSRTAAPRAGASAPGGRSPCPRARGCPRRGGSPTSSSAIVAGRFEITQNGFVVASNTSRATWRYPTSYGSPCLVRSTTNATAPVSGIVVERPEALDVDPVGVDPGPPRVQRVLGDQAGIEHRVDPFARRVRDLRERDAEIRREVDEERALPSGVVERRDPGPGRHAARAREQLERSRPSPPCRGTRGRRTRRTRPRTRHARPRARPNAPRPSAWTPRSDRPSGRTPARRARQPSRAPRRTPRAAGPSRAAAPRPSSSPGRARRTGTRPSS